MTPIYLFLQIGREPVKLSLCVWSKLWFSLFFAFHNIYIYNNFFCLERSLSCTYTNNNNMNNTFWGGDYLVVAGEKCFGAKKDHSVQNKTTAQTTQHT